MTSESENLDFDKRENAVKLYSGETCEEIPMEQIAVILGKPKLLWVPGAPPRIAGMVEWKGRLAPVRYLEGAGENAPFQCVVLVKKEGGDLLGLLADRLTGGDSIDPFYG